MAIFNAIQAAKQTKSAKRAEQAQANATNALDRMSAARWNTFQENYKPVVQKYITTVEKGIPTGPVVGQASGNVIQAENAVLPTVAGRMMGSGVNVNSARFRNALNAATTASGLADAGAQADAARGVNAANFNNRLAMLQTGRGIPGMAMQGQAEIARRYAIDAEAYRAAAGKSAQNAAANTRTAALLFGGMA
jgi:hypothetical protein